MFKKIILSLVALAFGISIYGILNMGWDFNEMSGVFFAMGLSAGLVGKGGSHQLSFRHVRLCGIAFGTCVG